MSVACGESEAPTAMVLRARSESVRIGASARTTTTDVRSRSVSRIARAAGLRPRAPRARCPSALDPRERRVPRNVDLSRELPLDLPLVVRVQDEFEREPALDEM